MLIRNARLPGHTGLTDLRLMHGAVREVGAGLEKGLYESELDVSGDELRAWQGEPLPRVRKLPPQPAFSPHVVPGTLSPLLRWRGGCIVSAIDEHAAD